MNEILENSPIGIAIVIPNSQKSLFINNSLSQMFGAVSTADLRTRNMEASWVDSVQFEKFCTLLNAGENLVNFKAKLFRIDGSVFTVLMNSHPTTFEGHNAHTIWHTDVSKIVKASGLIEQSNTELKKLIDERTQQLKHNKERFQQYSEVSSDWFWEMGPDLRFTYFSERVLEIVNVPAEFHIGKTRKEIAGEDCKTLKWQQHLQDLEDHKPFKGFKYNRKAPSGELHYLTVSGRPQFDESGKFTGYIGVGSDHTNHIVAQDQAKVANERLAAAIDALSEPFALWDPDDRLIIANHQFRTINSALGDNAKPGVKYVDFAQALVDFNVVPEALGNETAWLKNRTELHFHPKGPFEQKRSDGRWFMIHEQRFPDGSIATINTDITTVKKAEARLKESQQRFRDFASVAADWYWEQGADLRFKNVSENEKPVNIMQLTMNPGKTRRETNPLDVTEEQLSAHEKQLLAREPFIDFRFSRIRRDQTKVYMTISGSPVFDEQGNFTGYRGAGRDITEIVEAQKSVTEERDRAESANRAKSEFLANMSHELRTPLNSIIGYSQMIEGEQLGKVNNPKYIEYAHDIHSSGQHLLLVISDILDISKVEAGEIYVEEVEVNVLQTIEDAVMFVKLLGKFKNQHINIDIPSNVPRLLVDDRLVRQVLINLLSNAVKFTPKGGHITLSAKTDPDQNILISVTDTGVGIAPEHIETALSPFGQVRTTSNVTHEGTGLGLPLSKKLMELHDGSLSIESEAGIGTTITLCFPQDRVIN